MSKRKTTEAINATPELRRMRVADIRRADYNPRKMSREASAALEASLRTFGVVEPLVWNATTERLVGGHQRLDVLERAGATETDVVVVRLDEAHERALNVALNSPELAGAFTEDLDALLRGIEPDLGALFGELRLDALLAGEGNDDPVPDDDPPDPPADPVTKPGDLWTLGDHQLLCASCERMPAQYGEGVARLLVTDPPYGVSYAAKNEFLNAVDRGNRVQTPIRDDHHTPQEMSALWASWFGAVRQCCAPGAGYYVTGPQGGDLLLLLLALRDADFPLRHMLVWVKDQFVLGRSDYHYQHEPIIYGWVEGAAHHAVVDRGESSTWHIPKPRKSDLHPTMKPVELYARAMRNSSDPGDVVLEPFAGSGTALIAAEAVGRIVRATEVDPAYCDVIVERWQGVTGGKATRVQS